MRNLIVCNAVSLDGYYTGPDGNVMALELDPAFDAYNVERLRAADTLLLGRRSFEGFKSFWPPVADDPEPRWTPAQREVSRLDNAIEGVRDAPCARSQRAPDQRQGVDASGGGLVPGVTLPTFLGLRADLRSIPLNPFEPARRF